MSQLISIQCPRCGEFCLNKNVLALHQLGEHHCYKEGADIAERLLHSILTTKGECEYIMHREKGTCGKYQLLYGWHRVWFQKTHYYDGVSQSFIPKHGVELSKAKYIVDEQTLGRRARELQQEDRELFHKWHLDDKGKKFYTDEWLAPHDCIQASAQTRLKREILQEETRLYYAEN